jgi:hypothetical protein
MKKTIPKRILGGLTERLATYLFGNATQRVKNFMKEHGEEKITSLTIARTPIQGAIATAMELASGGNFESSVKKQGYDKYFHLYLIINGKYKLEKNQNLNIVDYKPQEDEEQYPLSSPNKTINEFIQKGIDQVGEKDFFGNYDPLKRNCQWLLMNLLKGNGLYSKAVSNFTVQDTEELQDNIEPFVKDSLKETTDFASGLDKFTSWISNGIFGLKRGGNIVSYKKNYKIK